MKRLLPNVLTFLLGLVLWVGGGLGAWFAFTFFIGFFPQPARVLIVFGLFVLSLIGCHVFMPRRKS